MANSISDFVDPETFLKQKNNLKIDPDLNREEASDPDQTWVTVVGESRQVLDDAGAVIKAQRYAERFLGMRKAANVYNKRGPIMSYDVAKKSKDLGKTTTPMCMSLDEFKAITGSMMPTDAGENKSGLWCRQFLMEGV